MHKTLLDKINFAEHKEKTEDLLDMLLCNVKEENPKLYKHIESEMYEMVYGKAVSPEMAEKWVMNLIPRAKWAKEDVQNVLSTYGINIPIDYAYVLFNMAYSDYADVLGDGNTEESINRYIEYVKDFFYDEDYKGDGKEKVFDYGKYIFKII